MRLASWPSTWAFGKWLVVTACSFVALSSAGAQDLTAQELLDKASKDYVEGRHAEALEGFLQFRASYGESDQAAEAVAAMRVPIAMCFLQTQRFAEALDAITHALETEPEIPRNDREELLFWKGICEVQQGQHAEARATLETFLAEFPRSRKAEEALLMGGTTLILEQDFSGAAEAFESMKPRLGPENRGRAVVLELFARSQGESMEPALELIVSEFPNMDSLLQIVTFQTLTLQVGSSLLEAEDYRRAIQCLQRVWKSERLLEHQTRRLTDLESRLAALEAQPRSDPYAKFLLAQMIAKVERELENFRKIENFDSALRLRLATAFLKMERYREAALIMEEMLAEMPPDAVVEGASVTLAQSWMQIDRWEKLRQATEIFEEKFPASSKLPLMLYMRGVAHQKDSQHTEAIATFVRITEEFPDSEFAPRASFQTGFTQLLAQQNRDAVETFQNFRDTHGDHELAESSLYWLGMAFSLDKQFETARQALDGYLAEHPQGKHVGAATFRKAYCAHSAQDFETSIQEFRDYLKRFDGHENESEALVLLGDGLMNRGQMEEGIAVLKEIPKEETRFYEEGWFKIGKALRLMEEPERLTAHMQTFVSENPGSPRVAEAIYWIGWVHRQNDNMVLARQVYWDAIRRLGNEPRIFSVEDLFSGLSKLYPDSKDELLDELTDLGLSASSSGQTALASRALWAQAALLAKSDPEESRNRLLTASGYIDVKWTNPLILADVSDALLSAGEPAQAEQLYRDLIKWNPQAPQKDRALVGMARVAQQRGDVPRALELYERFEEETAGSVLFGEVALERARIHRDRDQESEARALLEELLANEYVGKEKKALALFEIGESFQEEGDLKRAFPYYQRIYILYNRWSDLVAKAYLESGSILEELDDQEGAAKTYREMLERPELAEFPETAEARTRLDRMDVTLEASQS